MSKHTISTHDIARPVAFLGVAYGKGAPDPRCAEGPGVLQAVGVAEHVHAAIRPAHWRAILTPRSDQDNVNSLADCASQIASEVRASVESGYLPVVLAGDHASAIGTWRGVGQTMSDEPIGLLWIDAHLDSHTPETSHTGALHGMPLACLLGHGPSALTQGTAVLRPHKTCVLGVRSFEPEEKALLDHLGVRVFPMEEIVSRGFSAVFEDALAIIRDGTAGYGVTVDLDALDPMDAPGVNTPVAGGILARDLCAAFAKLHADPHLLALELTEYNPYCDADGKTVRVVKDLLGAIFHSAGVRRSFIDLESRYGARNYDPLPVVLAKGSGVYLWDTEGRRYLDMMSAYSAVSLGHGHPRLLRALERQARALAVTSRAFYNNRLPLFLKRLCELTGYERALPVNTGLEAVETALKAARKWAHKVKDVPADKAEIIACNGNFHGRSIAIVGLSSESQYRDGFGPFPPGLKRIAYGDASALEQAITPNTAAFLVEPIQGEGGIVVPPHGYLKECARICREHDVLLICDEVQTGLGRTGKLFACEHEGVKPDGLILGKALGGGLLPVSAFLADEAVMRVFTPGDHGSTFGGNPLASAVALEALNVIVEERLAERSAELGDYLLQELQKLSSPLIQEVRGRGLFVGIEIRAGQASARDVCDRLMARGVLSKDTHGTVVRLAPPLIITREQLDWVIEQVQAVLSELYGAYPRAA